MALGFLMIDSSTTNAIRLIADIGGTNARFAFVEAGSHSPQGIHNFLCDDYSCVDAAIRAYMEQQGITRIGGLCLAVAGPVHDGPIKLTNNSWVFDAAALQKTFAAPVKIINDFTAQALSIRALAPTELEWIGATHPEEVTRSGTIKVVAGAGTGFGVAAILADGDILSSEGGHVAFAPADDHEIQLLSHLWARYRRVSIERVLSGEGLSNLYWANAKLRGLDQELAAPKITAGAAAGDELCLQAIADFYAILGSVVGDLAILFGANGGIYLTGGMLPKLWQFFDLKQFRERVENKGRFREFCASLPIALVRAEQPGLLGCAVAAHALLDKRAEVDIENAVYIETSGAKS